VLFETMIKPADGTSYPAEISLRYLRDEQPPILVAIVHDTRERHKLGE
jgi:two-component system CheB/CheR fusion protein